MEIANIEIGVIVAISDNDKERVDVKADGLNAERLLAILKTIMQAFVDNCGQERTLAVVSTIVEDCELQDKQSEEVQA